MSLKGFLIEHIELLMKDANTKALDSLLSFWNNKINGKNFSAFKNIHSIISESDKLIKVLQEHKNKKGNTTITVKEDYYDPSDMNFDLVRKSLPPHYLKSKNKSINIVTDSYKVTSPIIAMEEEKENEEDEEDESPNQVKQKNTFFNSRLKSSTNVLVYELDANPNEDEDESISRNDKKSKTVGGNENNLNSQNFTYQEEIENVNFIIKKKKFTNFISFIDIDLFLQYLASDKNFFENKEDDKLLVEGFCLQYQSFILAKTLISKIISSFDYFYLGLGKEIDKKDSEENTEHTQRRKNAYSRRKLSESCIKIPYGIIDLLCTFITIHNIYCHNELSSDLINQISEFLNRLSDISEIKEKFADKLETAEIELKEYEVSIKRKDSNPDDANEFTSDEIFNLGLDEEKNENEEKDGKKQNARVMLPKAGTFNSSFKLNILEPKNKANFLNIYADQKQKAEEKLYEFDIMKYKLEDIAFELTRVNYSLYSRIKIKEFLKGVFNGKDKYKLSPHICRIIKRFNNLSAWVIEEILAYDHAEKRSQVLLRFIKICVILQKIGNFDDCLSIMTGLTNSNINKLQKTWGHIRSTDQKEFLGLKKLLSFEDNWRNLRNEVEKQMKDKKFFIPYLGYYTKRIMFLEEMGPYIKKNTSLVNIEKILEVYKVLKEFYKLKEVKNKYHCADENIRKELYLLQCLDPSNEDFLFQTANLLEPKFILSNKKLNSKRRTNTDKKFYNNINKVDII